MVDKSAKPSDMQQPVIVKKYANRRLYNTESSTYVTLEDLAKMVRADRDFIVYDAKSGADLTHSVLTQIIVEQESRPGGNPMLPIPFLRQLIRFYGKGIERMVPSYLQVSLDALAREQDNLTKQFSSAFGGSPFESYQDQARKNIAMFEQAMSVFSPFSAPMGGEGQPDSKPGARGPSANMSAGEQGQDDAAGQETQAEGGAARSQPMPSGQKDTSRDDDLRAMKSQIDEMQKMILKLSKQTD